METNGIETNTNQRVERDNSTARATTRSTDFEEKMVVTTGLQTKAIHA